MSKVNMSPQKKIGPYAYAGEILYRRFTHSWYSNFCPNRCTLL